MKALNTILFAVLALLVCTTTRAAPIPVTVCFPAAGGLINQIIFLPQYYTYQNIVPKPKMVGFAETIATPRGLALGLAQNGTDCYVYFGPTTSTMATAVNAIMNSVWISQSVSATEFSDRVNYPLFNRVAPAADVNQRAIMSIMTRFNWTTVNILCSDNAYGQAVAGTISGSVGKLGGSAVATCVTPTGAASDVAAVVQQALNSPSRILFIAAISNEAAMKYGVQAINQLDVNRKLIVIFAEPICILNDPLWKTVPGSFCATFATTPSYDPFWNAFLGRDISVERSVVNAITGLKYNPVTANATTNYGGYNALAADAGRIVYNALDRYVGLYGQLPANAFDAVAVLRNETLEDGFMGPIEIPKGDRVRPTYMRILNAGFNNVTTIVANFTSDGNLTLSNSFFVLGQQLTLDKIPPAVDPTITTVSQAAITAIAVVVSLVVVLLIGAGIYMLRQQQLLAVRPMDPSAPFAVMFVGIKNVDEVRDSGDANASAAFAQVANDVRAAARASGCYEARRVDESTVMIVAKSAENTLKCASQLMVSADRVDWHAVMKHENELEMLAQLRRDRSGTDTRSHCSRTTRKSHKQTVSPKNATVRSRGSVTGDGTSTKGSHLIAGGAFPVLHIGIHFGFGMIDHDESLNTVSYVGKAVTRAAEVADVAVGGQVLVSRECHEAAEGSSVPGSFEQVGAWESVAPDTIVFIPTAQTPESVMFMKAQVKRAIESVGKAGRHAASTGTIAAALQRAEAGLSQRRIGVACIRVPGLHEIATNASKLSVASELVGEVTSIAAVHRGEIHSMSNGTFIITVNASTPAAQPVPRAAQIALEVIEYLEAHQMEGTAGVAGGMALVGRPAQGAAFATFGYAIECAETAQRMAEKHGLKVCAVDTNSYDDLSACLHVVTFGVVPTQSRDGLARLLAVVGERDTTAGEWLYSVAGANEGLASNEHAWDQMSRLEAPSVEAMSLVDAEAANTTSVLWCTIYGLSLRNLRGSMMLLQDTAAADTDDAAAVNRASVIEGIAALNAAGKW